VPSAPGLGPQKWPRMERRKVVGGVSLVNSSREGVEAGREKGRRRVRVGEFAQKFMLLSKAWTPDANTRGEEREVVFAGGMRPFKIEETGGERKKKKKKNHKNNQPRGGKSSGWNVRDNMAPECGSVQGVEVLTYAQPGYPHV